jgi:nucleolar GTP-binding protein
MKNDSFMKKSSTKPKLGRNSRKRERSVSRLRDEMDDLGVELDEEEMTNAQEAAEPEFRGPPLKRAREDSEGRVRSSSKTPRDVSGIRDPKTRDKVRKIAKKAQIPANRNARKGEGDRKIPNVKPKHLFAGKRKLGKTTRR